MDAFTGGLQPLKQMSERERQRRLVRPKASLYQVVARVAAPTRLKAGDQVGEWTLQEYQPGQKKPRVVARWRCVCSCGEERWISVNNLQSGRSRSCGHGNRVSRLTLLTG